MKGEFKVGDIVYLAYTPVKCGRIIEIIPGKEYEKWPGEFEPAVLKIKTLKGDIITHGELSVYPYRRLVEDHKRKYEKHAAVLAKLEAL